MVFVLDVTDQNKLVVQVQEDAEKYVELILNVREYFLEAVIVIPTASTRLLLQTLIILKAPVPEKVHG